VRKVNLTYFIEDNTIQIVERPSLNSGIPQGTLVERTQVAKPDGDGIFMPHDMKLGEILQIFGRNYRLVDADYATRKYVRNELGVAESAALTVPRDAYEELRKEAEPGGDAEEWGKYHSKKNANKDFMAASIGRFVDNSGREGFIKFGNDTINFLCVWDNTTQLYGDKMQFSLKYHLADDTLEIFSVQTANSGRDTNTKLLKRSHLPKRMDNIVPTLSDPVVPDYVHWTDLYIGLELSVFGRQLRIIDADPMTREFYEDYSEPLGPSIIAPPPKVIKFEREIPPPTGYGSEADSLASCSGAIRPSQRKGDEKTLNFFAKLLSGGVDDVDRRFVVSFYMVDGTVKVQEPPVRNSGFVGGLFLSRRELKDAEGEPYDETNLYIGGFIQILKHRFEILGANNGTFKYMEEHDHKFTRSNAAASIAKLSRIPTFNDQCNNGEMLARFPSKKLPLADFRALCEEFGMYSNTDGMKICDHELITMCRKSGDPTGAVVDMELLIDEVKVPGGYRFY
jgi:hypothetical protein